MSLKHTLNYEKKDKLVGLAFLLPWIVGFFGLTLYPVIYSVILSLSNVQLYPGKTVLNYAGFQFYDYAWNVDTQFRLDVSEAVVLICCATPVIVVFSLIIALLLNRKFVGRTFLRAVFFLPVIVMSGPAISGLLTSYTVDFSTKNPEIFSLINALPGIIRSPLVYILNNLVLILWFSGVEIIVFLAGLQKISPSLYEAASIDGAGGWKNSGRLHCPISRRLRWCARFMPLWIFPTIPSCPSTEKLPATCLIPPGCTAFQRLCRGFTLPFCCCC